MAVTKPWALTLPRLWDPPQHPLTWLGAVEVVFSGPTNVLPGLRKVNGADAWEARPLQLHRSFLEAECSRARLLGRKKKGDC